MDSNHTTNHDFSPPPRHLPLGSSSSALQSRSNESSNENRAWSLPVTQDPVDQFSFSKAPSTSKNLPLNRSTVQESSSHTSSDVDSTEDQSRERGDSVRVREKEGSLSSEESEEMELESSIVTPQQGRYRSAQQQQQQQQGGSSIDGRVVGLPTPKSNGGYDQYQINPLNQSMRSMVPGSNVRAPPTFSNVLNHALGGSAAARRPNPSSSNSSHSSSALANPSIHVNSRQNQISSDSISPLDSRMQSQPARAGNVRPVQSNQSPSLSSSNAPGPQQSLRSNQTQGSNSSPRMNPNLANAGGNLLSMGSRMIPTNAARSSTARATTPSGVAREDVGSLDNFFACIPALQKDMAQKESQIVLLREQLKTRTAELTQARVDKEQVKREAIERLKTAIDRSETTRQELETTANGMRQVFTQIQSELGDSIAVADIKAELESAVESLAEFLNGDRLVLEKNEQTKIAVLKQVTAEIEKYQGAVKLLRDQLETATGQLVEGRERINSLEGQLNTRMNTMGEKIFSIGDQLVATASSQHLELVEGLHEARDQILILNAELEQVKESERDVAKELKEEKAAVIRLQTQISSLESEKMMLVEKVAELQAQFDRDASENAETIRLLREENTLSLAKLVEANSASEAARNERDALISDQAVFKTQAEQLLQQVKQDANSERQAIEDASNEAKVKSEEEIQNIKDQLQIAQDELVEARQRLDRSVEDAKDNSALETKIQTLRDELTECQVEAANSIVSERSNVALEMQQLRDQKSTLQTSNDTTAAQLLEVRNELVQLSSDRSAFVITKSTLEADLKILQDAAMNHGIEVKTLKEELRNVTAKNEEWKVETKKIAYRECLAGNERAQGLLQNDLKRANNKNLELERKLLRSQGEAAKAKNRPLIDPNPSYSSPGDPISEDRRQPSSDVEYFAEDIVPVVLTIDPIVSAKSSSTLSSISMEDGDQDEIVDCTVAESPVKPAGRKPPAYRNKRKIGHTTTIDEVEEVEEELSVPAPAAVSRDKGRLPKAHQMKKKKK